MMKMWCISCAVSTACELTHCLANPALDKLLSDQGKVLQQMKHSGAIKM